MSDFIARQGQTYQLPVTVDDDSAETVMIDVWNDDGIILTTTTNFLNKEATLDLGVITDDIGIYSALVTVTYSDGSIDILPLQVGCGDDNCKFLTFQICEGIPEGS